MKKCDVFGFILLALGVGVAAGILIAPKSGRETRKELSEKMEKGFEEASSFLSYESGRIKNFFDETVENFKNKTDSE
ncbi:MAG: YtxH domain-containing protein [Actinomycetota bacterium]|nr:YtxH domain-containing protein [Actinomycetota bacterium]